jgi:hypothetical protein
MSRNCVHLKNHFQSPEELREKEWMRLEDRITARALALWRRKGKPHLDALSAWRRAELEVISQNGNARVRVQNAPGSNRRDSSHGHRNCGRK